MGRKTDICLGREVWYRFLLAVFVLSEALAAAEAGAAYKRWVPNMDFNNPRNWNTGRVPCQNDRVVFSESSAPVFVQTNATVVEIVLPTDGELVLGNYVSFSFPAARSDDSSCPGSDVQFNRTESKDWFDPDNWCDVTGPGGSCLNSQSLRLETEGVPCRNEGVVFPESSTFLVNLESAADVFISSLHYAGKSLTTEGFRSFLDSKEGQKQFVRETGGRTTINVQQQTCNDVTGCMCGNDAGQVQRLVCQSVEDRCPPPACSQPLTPMGGCCTICGAIVDLDYGAMFKTTSLQNMINRYYLQDRPDVKLIVSKTSTDHIQVVLKDDSGGSQALWVANKVAQTLRDDMNQGGKYGVTQVTLRGSGGSAPSTGARTGKASGMGGGMIAIIVIAGLVLLIVLVLVVFCITRKDRLKLPNLQQLKANTFQRFGGPDDNLEMEDSASFKDISFGRASMRSDRSLEGFENPTYDIPMAQQQQQLQLQEQNGGDAVGGQDAQNLDAAHATFVRTDDNSNDPKNTSFLNPMYSQGGKDPYLDASITQTTLRFNPVYSEEGVEEDSKI